MLSFSRLSLAVSVSAATLVSTIGSALLPIRAMAQSRLPACPPPVAQEYLLLVRGENETERRQIAAALPADNTVLVCQYLDEVLVRAGGFTSLETANAWATYMVTVEGYESFVSKPTDGAAQTNPSSTAQNAVQTSAQTPAGQSVRSSTGGAGIYQPLRLGAGYAVLVNYGDRPEIADTVSQVVRPVGLAVYRGQAYLLADYTSDADSAAATLQRLIDAQTTAIVVDAQEVVRMTPAVARF
ncbi:MAG: hypothetical protein DCF25_01240 [Leptolyngbya foveolarum]|uniref:Uncharacterized protein n=1 Tax=Leptolyngbya foveolarum TaxID=47253 RepID=A0A2W4WL62_9CYAN|nr:MAG: hypothetical protein DCF25_01240 [Leptolyngbya foveolarum]